ncbi:hypothetical protein D3C80_908660 [compost metagenome]
MELNAHLAEDATALHHHFFFQLEGRNTEGQQATDLGMTIVNHRFHAVAGQHIGTGQTGRTGTDHRHPFAGRQYMGHVRLPAHFDRFVADIALDVTDGHRTELIVESTRAFTQAILWANAAADFRQAVGLVRQIRRLHDATFIRQLQPVRDVVVNRAFPFAIRVTAGQTTVRLRFRLSFRKRLVNLYKLNFTDLQRFLWRINALQVDKLINILTH